MNDPAINQAELLAQHRGDWMRKALGLEHLTGIQMAEFLEVDEATVSRWLNGKSRAGKQTLRVWAMRTGAPLSYLETGIIPEGWTGPNGTPSENTEKLRFHNLHSRDNVTDMFRGLRTAA
jgi:transcriptional regulator with XRE-family HTH domain